MEIVNLDNRITFQKKTLNIDEFYQQIEEWSDFFTCWSNVKLLTVQEEDKKGVTRDVESYSFVVRKMRELKRIDSLKYRISFNNKNFDIIEVDTFSKDNKYLRIKGVSRND